ncbi:unannotated protein [freshwater metagenome]|uniref:Unannotated protein n=1 Tax=freshwater metagenome TaxID=449393 RepID=A0A6J7NFA1_9ZZZZ
MTIPMRRASSASTKRPVMRISSALPKPTMRGNSHEVPTSPPVSPMRMNAALNRAAGEAIRISAASASAMPAPAAAPFTAAITGLSICRNPAIERAHDSCQARRSAAFMSGSVAARSRSRPAQKARPVPVTMSTRAVGSLSTSCCRFANASNISKVMALSRSGRLRRATTISEDTRSTSRVLTVLTPLSRYVRPRSRTGARGSAGRPPAGAIRARSGHRMTSGAPRRVPQPEPNAREAA